MDDSLRLLTTAHRDLAGVLGSLPGAEAWSRPAAFPLFG
ncbi:MAG: hypothetical protein JWQ99_1764 [Blastococcus sp.]|nr:hypothetical protein [Blastococcus sp.]